MKKLIPTLLTTFALALSLAHVANAAVCDKHEHGKPKSGKSTSKTKNSKTKSKVTTVPSKSDSSKVSDAGEEHCHTAQTGGSVDKSANDDHASHDQHSDDHSMHDVEGGDASGKVVQAVVGMDIPDLEVLDQNNRRVQFYSDLVKGKTVAINFIFTTCTTICTPLGATFASIQKTLKATAKDDVQLISISVDPVTDTPERLKAWQQRFKADGGWTLVTGDKQTIDKLLEKLAASAAKRDDHSAMVLIGNDSTGRWTRTYGLAKPSQIIALIDETRAGGTAAQTLTKGGTK